MRKALDRYGYRTSANPHVVFTEAPAWISSGEAGRLGLSASAGFRFIRAYFREVAKIYGTDKAMKLFERAEANTKGALRYEAKSTRAQGPGNTAPIPAEAGGGDS